MAANNFATMLHKNTHKLTLILVYAVLEWILIFLLLLNSLFNYLITKFANYFGLKPPCPWCSRIDHVLDRRANTINSRSEVVCQTHATEISKLSYCANHQKLAQSRTMCVDCLDSRRDHDDESVDIRRIAFVSWVDNSGVENCEEIQKCSCCDERLSNDLYPPCLLFKPKWDSFKFNEKGRLVVEAIDDTKNDGIDCKEVVCKNDCLVHFEEDKEAISTDCCLPYTEESKENEMNGKEERCEENKDADEHQVLSVDEPELSHKETEANITEKVIYGIAVHHDAVDDLVSRRFREEDRSLESIMMHLKRNVDTEINRVIPVELVDLSTIGSTIGHDRSCDIMEVCSEEYHCNGAADSTKGVGRQANCFEEAAVTKENQEELPALGLEDTIVDAVDKEFKEETSPQEDNQEELPALGLEDAKADAVDEELKEETSPMEIQTSALAAEIDEASDAKSALDLPAREQETDDCKSLDGQVESKIIAGSSQESTPSLMCLQQDQPSHTTEADETPNGIEMSTACNGHDSNDYGKASVEKGTISFEKYQDEVNHQQHTKTNEAEEKSPETPTSLDSFQNLHKKSVLIEKRESAAEESLDGSVISEMDSADPILTVERLRAELNAERKAMRDLYAELEEERSASAIAANQTMAMINRLQEEKASMQMEALQYQRMMEEQSEYDQEALQLLNELMIKREKEKQELEKELEASRKKIIEYEEKEKMRIIRRITDGSVRSRNSSETYSNADDIDTLPVDLDHKARDENGSIVNGNVASDNNIPDDDEATNLEEIALDCVKQMSALDGSLAEFEEERLSILDQLKALEEKLLTMSDNELIEDINLAGCSSTHNAAESADVNEFGTPDANGSNELPEDRLYHQRLSMASMAKNLLPLLDAAGTETEEGFLHEQNIDSGFIGTGSSSAAMFELDNKRASIEEEVDRVYERLQALEADREFLKHCMSSINNGDKGMDLLQEILQHLRDLKSVELRVRNMSDSPLS